MIIKQCFFIRKEEFTRNAVFLRFLARHSHPISRNWGPAKGSKYAVTSSNLLGSHRRKRCLWNHRTTRTKFSPLRTPRRSPRRHLLSRSHPSHSFHSHKHPTRTQTQSHVLNRYSL
ncbi:hypothetical protein BLNAU_16922 [Blattamonas nauphoetae]|uniref:Uncharacterized protein n=1 Tax=Blattamonas nauphoetae TaxID=2049346 RepID=A0ABQ9XA47_9EUKA|nr:hypothetical protein BLNAU_16922 [Blattamonas nauphoetae]